MGSESRAAPFLSDSVQQLFCDFQIPENWNTKFLSPELSAFLFLTDLIIQSQSFYSRVTHRSKVRRLLGKKLKLVLDQREADLDPFKGIKTVRLLAGKIQSSGSVQVLFSSSKSLCHENVASVMK